MSKPFSLPRPLPALLAVALAAQCVSARADERESLEALRQTTLTLIEALVEQGVLPRAKADAMLAQARASAAQAPQAGTDATAKAASRTVRVPYVPQAVKDQIRNEVREEVVAQARAERWGVPNATAAWTERIKVEGDLRLRYQSDRFGSGNLTPDGYVLDGQSTAATRAADFLAVNDTFAPTGNTTADRGRLRLRARLDVNAKVSDSMSTGVRLSTGSATDRVSTNQTLGQNFNKYQVFVDRAYFKIDPTDWLSISGGRIANPWFSTDLVWSENLNFEGVAVTAQWPNSQADAFQPFATVGAFPIREDAPPKRNRWLYGAQIGAQWQANARTQLRFGLAQYIYKNIEGQVDTDYDLVNKAGASYGQYEYGQGLRQKGNTLVGTNSPIDEADGINISEVIFGLASKFKPLALTAAARFSHFSPYDLLVSAEYVTNLGYDEADILRRTGFPVKGRKDGYQLKAAFGNGTVQNLGDWQASVGYRWIGSDAVLDAFTDSDLGLGGTNLQGLTLGLQYGVDRNATLGVRYLSAKQIDSFAIARDGKFSVDTIQVDFNVRF
jgi:hypothetical protein